MPTAKAAKVAPRAKRPKAEIQREFEDVMEEAAKEKEGFDSKSAEAARVREEELRHAVEGITVEGVVQRISGLGLDISRALSDISEKLAAEVQHLSEVRQAVEIETKELARLHKIDIAATAIDQLVQDYQRQNEQMEAEITARRAAWAEEIKNVERERKEQEESLRKQRQREIDEYEYKKTLERKKAQDKYDEEVKLLEKQNREKQEQLEKSWQQREASLKEREDEFARLKKEVETFPARLEAEAKRAASESAKAAEAQFKQEILLLKKDAESERRMSELRAKALEETLARQTAQIAMLDKQVEEAKQQVQDIAVKAIEGASGARALSHVNQIAIEQAKTRPQRD
ncbi:MAG TPA: hypothetical protein VKV15_24595 [Bryobacteraceae bacterium]|nr:hypothetical protein [Bryobacteraceae bacterium]